MFPWSLVISLRHLDFRKHHTNLAAVINPRRFVITNETNNTYYYLATIDFYSNFFISLNTDFHQKRQLKWLDSFVTSSVC